MSDISTAARRGRAPGATGVAQRNPAGLPGRFPGRKGPAREPALLAVDRLRCDRLLPAQRPGPAQHPQTAARRSARAPAVGGRDSGALRAHPVRLRGRTGRADKAARVTIEIDGEPGFTGEVLLGRPKTISVPVTGVLRLSISYADPADSCDMGDLILGAPTLKK